MLVLSLILSVLQVGSCNDEWGVQPKGSHGSSVEAVDGVVPEPDKQWTAQGKADEESSSSDSSSSGSSSDSDSEDSAIPVANQPSVEVDPENRRHEARPRPPVDRAAQLDKFFSEHSEDIQLAALVCCGLIAVVILAPFVVALLGGVSVGAVGLGALVCLCSPVIIAVACCCCCLMLLGYGHK